MSSTVQIQADSPGPRHPFAGSQPVRVTDIDIAFTSMIWLFIKASFAAAIATVITSVLWIGILTGMAAVMITILTAIGAGIAASAGAPPSAPPQEIRP